uniref:Uncharacterized protein n=1 Tax=Meloidogyne enterolobii TaxID=390850 RepID=A0A6V7WBR3_MELEN|nr:unnamed protein product [Meloidogyne enterolobii]
MEINDKNQKIPQEPLKSSHFPPSQQQLSTLPTIPESKRLALHLLPIQLLNIKSWASLERK